MTKSAPVFQPRFTKSESARRKPIKATPTRKTVEAVKSMPSRHLVSSYKNAIAIPNNKAKSITGEPYCSLKKSAASPVITATPIPGSKR